MGLRKKVALIFLLFFAINIIGFGSVYIVVKEQANDANVINLAGRQRALSQKMTKESMYILLGDSSQETKEMLGKTAGLFNKTLKGFIEGDAEQGLFPTKDEDILKDLTTLQRNLTDT